MFPHEMSLSWQAVQPGPKTPGMYLSDIESFHLKGLAFGTAFLEMLQKVPILTGQEACVQGVYDQKQS